METIENDDNTDFSIYIEKLKENHEFDTFIETLVYYHDNETDMEMEAITKLLNQRILDKIALEANERNLLKNRNELLTIDL